VPLNILLADDSVPAQNMGKKILVDAGYHVLTVSNGLEALRRIADATPDIAILDIFMPGYTGLEVCERLRANAATATLPVILTVGKLEPYRPSDGEHVHSNAVIVKPFAAAELIAAVRSLIGEPQPVQAEPEPAGELIAANAENNSLPESRSATEIVEPPPASVAEPSASTEPLAGGLQEEVADEPLFSYGESSVPGDAAPLIAPEASVYAAGPLATGDELGGAGSLVFNPDAEHVPFSASAADVLSPASDFPAEDTAPSFGEFDLEVDASPYAAGPDLEFSTVEEPTAAAPVATMWDEGFAEDVAVSVVGDAPARAELPVGAPEAAAAVEEVVSSAPAEVQPESPAIESPGMDPLLEVQEAAPGSKGASGEDRELPAQEILGEAAPVREEAVPASAAEQPAQDEEARRLAFEALFNSTELIPLEENPAPPAALPMEALPSIADVSGDQPVGIEPDSELETLSDDSLPSFLASEPDPYLLEEEQPLNAVGEIPDRDPLLEGGEASTWGSEEVPAPEGAFASDAGEVFPAQPEEGGNLTAAVEVITVEAPQWPAEYLPKAVDVPVAAPVAESAPMEIEAVPAPVAEMAAVPELLTEPDCGALEIPAAAPAAGSVPMVSEATEAPAQAEVEAAPVEAQQTAAEPMAHAAAVEVIEVITVEAPQALDESHPEALEVLSTPPAVESAPVGSESAQELAEAEVEAAPIEAQQTAAEPMAGAAAVEAITLEAPQALAETHAEALEVLEAAPAAESTPVAPESAEPAQAAEEAAAAEAQQTAAEPIAHAVAVEAVTVEAPEALGETDPEALEVLEAPPVTESAPVIPEAAAPAQNTVEAAPAQIETESALEPVQVAPQFVEPYTEVEQAPVAPIAAPAEAVHREAALQMETLASTAEVPPRPNDAERIHQAVERVFDRYRPVLIAAIVRELIRHD
jgi:CheY-like chemotaxis protein